jgi:RNA polymerase sigma-70 factor (ECF subfamily)
MNQRLSEISTVWTVLRQAHAGDPDEATAARQLLMERYGPAVRRYLVKVVGDAHAADDLTQEFALSLLRGEFRGADQQRGRFRQYLKSALFHLVNKYRNKERRLTRPPGRKDATVSRAADEENEREFLEKWRDQLLTRTWAALAEVRAEWHAVLRFKADHQELRSPELAERLSIELGKNWTASGIRQTLHRARERFGDLLLQEVAYSLQSPTLEAVEEELRDLNLLHYCQEALNRFRQVVTKK